MNPFEMLDFIRRNHPDAYWRARIVTYLTEHKYVIKEAALNEWRNPPKEGE